MFNIVKKLFQRTLQIDWCPKAAQKLRNQIIF